MSKPIIRITRLVVTPAQARRWEAAANAGGAPQPAAPGDVAAYRAALVKALSRQIHATERELHAATQPAVGAALAGQITGLRSALALVQGPEGTAPDA